MALRRRADERGAALFVVVLVVTLLTAVGVFAMHATSLAQLTSGYSRRAATTFYLGELAMNLRVATIGDDTSTYLQLKQAGTNCYASVQLNPLLMANAPDFCVVMTRDYAAQLATNDNTSLASDPEGFFGALNRPDSPLDQAVGASIRVESTDHRQAGKIPGFDLSSTTQIMEDTLTVSASLSPATVAGSECTTAVTRSSEKQWLRGYVDYVQP